MAHRRFTAARLAAVLLFLLTGCASDSPSSPTKSVDSFAPPRPNALSDASLAPNVAGEWVGEYIESGCRYAYGLSSACSRTMPVQPVGIKLRLTQQGTSLRGSVGLTGAEELPFSAFITESLGVYGEVSIAPSPLISSTSAVMKVNLTRAGDALVGDFVNDQSQNGNLIWSAKSSVSTPLRARVTPKGSAARSQQALLPDPSMNTRHRVPGADFRANSVRNR